MKKLKLKVDDVCKVIANISKHKFKIGEVVTIIECCPESEVPHYGCHNKNGFWFLNDEELELINQQ